MNSYIKTQFTLHTASNMDHLLQAIATVEAPSTPKSDGDLDQIFADCEDFDMTGVPMVCSSAIVVGVL